ncbi:MAG: hypothetical protein C5B49_15910 [Bdellovibrio sp.]|nr:MAG: hypothetical protein C5B49_15910 [Bdellovibrio sp.]
MAFRPRQFRSNFKITSSPKALRGGLGNMGHPRTTRRDFLKKTASLSVVPSLAPLLPPLLAPLLVPCRASAAAKAPLRLILLHSPFHFGEAYYHPQISPTDSGPAPAGSNFFLGYANSSLAPLAPFQKDLIIFRGLKYGAASSSHLSGGTAFTGSALETAGGTNPKISGTSIDQYLFNRMAQAGSLSPICAGLFTYLSATHTFDHSIVFNNGAPLAQIDNPMNLYNALFANFRPPTNTPATPASMSQTARRQQALAFAQKYLNGLVGQLPSTSPSASALESHLAAIRGLAGQIAGSSANLAGCSPPSSSAVTNDAGPDAGNYVVSNAPLDVTSFINIITQAFACDITRFASFKMSDYADPSQILLQLMPGLTDFDQTTNWHAMTHTTDGSATNASDIKLAQFKAYFMNQAAALLSALKAVPDPYSTGQTLYDNTVVLIGSEGPVQTSHSDYHGNGDPRSDQPFIIAGGCGGYFKGGQLIFAGGSKSASVPHNALLTNIVNTFETNQQQFNPSYVPKILSQYGDYSFSVSPTSWLT